MTWSISVCVASLAALIWALRRDRVSLGLPVAYLLGLLLIHVPGAWAGVVDPAAVADVEATRVGIFFTAIGAVCFVGGVILARLAMSTGAVKSTVRWSFAANAGQNRFALFCLLGGWAFVYGLSPLHKIPSLGAVIDEAGSIWMLGVMLGLRTALHRKNPLLAAIWCGALLVFPVLMLLLGGFLSYGSAAIIVVGSALTISARSYGRVAAALAIAAYLGMTIFVNYFESRDAIRSEVWGGAGLEDRIDTVLGVASDFHWLHPADPRDLGALDERLNQNYFVGLAAERIAAGEADYLGGRSIWELIEALVPRAIWPDKPVIAGSPEIVSQMTGLDLSPTTSWGVGSVMEFQINFGLAGVVGGFLLLGSLLGMLDRKGAEAVHRGELGTAILFFLPAVALIQPNGSMVEVASGAAAATLAAHGWRWAWGYYAGHTPFLAAVRSGPSRRPR